MYASSRAETPLDAMDRTPGACILLCHVEAAKVNLSSPFPGFREIVGVQCLLLVNPFRSPT